MSWMMYEINQGKRSARVLQIASSLLTGKTAEGDWRIPERDWNAEVDAAYNYVRSQVRYTRDPHGLERFQKATRTLELGIGDCDDISILLGSILQSIGYPIILRIVDLGAGQYQHVYVLAGIPPHNPQTYKALDASRGEGPGWEVSGIVKHEDFLVTDTE